MQTDIKSDNMYAKQFQYFPDNIAPVNMTPFTPAAENAPVSGRGILHDNTKGQDEQLQNGGSTRPLPGSSQVGMWWRGLIMYCVYK